jgi:uncharacterized protein (TIGR02679 family)
VSDPVHDPAWARLLRAARRSLERTGGSFDGAVSIPKPTEAERHVIIGITGIHRSTTAERLVVRLVDLDTHLRQAYGRGLVQFAEVLSGAPVRNRPAEREQDVAARTAMLQRAATCVHAGQTWFNTWLSAIRRDGTLTRILRTGVDFGDVICALDALPAVEEPMPVFAERHLANTKALTQTNLRGILLRAIAVWQEAEPPGNAEQERQLWEAVGVIPDDLASQVLVLNLPATGGLIGGWLTQASAEGVPLRLTLHQLRLRSLTIAARDIYVTENPAILRAATAFGADAPPMVCAEGVPSAALHRLLSYADGATLWWRNDFDWPGIRMTAAALTRYPNARPWRMTGQDYLSGGDTGPPLLGGPAPTPWDLGLGYEMARTGRAVMEERLLPILLDDLAT